MTEISRTVSTALQSLRQREQTSRLAAEISDVSKEVTTGLKANPYDDLGHRSADAIAIRMQITRNDGFLTSNALLDRRFLAVETSLGAMRDVGQESERTRRLVLVATTAGMLMVPGNPAALTKMANPRRYIDPEFMNEHFMTLYGGMTRRAGSKEDHIGRLKPPSPRGYFYQLLAMLGWTSLPALPFMAKEVLVMMGDEDQIVPLINGRILASAIPNARLEVFEGGGHLFLLTHADESVAMLREFLDAPETKAEGRRAA